MKTLTLSRLPALLFLSTSLHAQNLLCQDERMIKEKACVVEVIGIPSSLTIMNCINNPENSLQLQISKCIFEA